MNTARSQRGPTSKPRDAHGNPPIRNSPGKLRLWRDGTKKTSLLHPGRYLLVLDLQFGISLCLPAYFLPEGVVFPGVGSHIGQDGHLVDVWIVFWIDIFQSARPGFCLTRRAYQE